MSNSKIYILFGNKKTVENYGVSVDYLIDNKTRSDYFVHSYKLSNYQQSLHFNNELSKYQEFLSISKKDFDIIYHDLCAEARSFMKTI